MSSLKDMSPAEMQRLLNHVTPEMYFGSIIQRAHELEKAEQSGITREDINFEIVQRCAQCFTDVEKIMRCSACKAVIYCSQKCATVAWNTPAAPGQPTHKQLCPANKRHMQHIPEAHAVLKSFPWGRLEKDDTFSYEVAKGRFDVLGNTNMGFWSQRGGPASHQFEGDAGVDLDAAVGNAGASWRFTHQLKNNFSHLDGYDLIHHKGHLSDERGWKLSDVNLIPYRNVSSLPADRRPSLVTEFEGGVHDWDSWYRWRKLPKRSPAALLMHVPLSVYHIITQVLKLTTPTAGSPEKRVKLCIHLTGAEVELNFLPLFSELALLLPYHDFTILIFGNAVHKLFEASKQSSVGGSPLRQSIAKKGPVFEYTAPQDLGSGNVKVHLYRDSAVWDQSTLATIQKTQPTFAPDALVALNAGLASYREWWDVIFITHRDRIPFAVTEYAEQSLEFAVQIHMPVARRGLPPSSYDIALNPFHRPGQRQMPTYKMPNLVNGFTLVVVNKE